MANRKPLVIISGRNAELPSSDALLVAKIIGGTSTTQTLTYQTTSGVGATGADHIFLVGNNGSVEPLRILNSGIISLPQTVGNQLRFTTSGSAFGRVLTASGISNWMATSMNASFSGGWNLDDTTKGGWFYKLDSRGIGAGTDEIAFIRVPTGANPHSDEYPLFRVLSTNQVSVGVTSLSFTPAATFEVTSRGTTTGVAMQINNSAGSAIFKQLDNAKTFIGGTTTPTAFLHLAAGTNTVSPFKLTNGVVLASIEQGAIETNSNGELFYSISSAIRAFVGLYSYQSKTANYTITAVDGTIDCTANSFTVTLPTAVGCAGKVYVINNSGAGTITVATTSSQTINGSITLFLVPSTSATVQSTGSNWIII